MAVLRATVSGIAPRRETGVGGLEEICRTLSDPAPELVVHGNADAVPSHAWSVLEPCLKEGLTNAMRHGAPGKVSVTLDIGPRIVRLCVHNEAGATGPLTPGEAGADNQGLGLRSLRQRAKAVGGSLTTDATNGFRLICVLPLSTPSSGGTPGSASENVKGLMAP
jgi:signal transduction histidine kinase